VRVRVRVRVRGWVGGCGLQGKMFPFPQKKGGIGAGHVCVRLSFVSLPSRLPLASVRHRHPTPSAHTPPALQAEGYSFDKHWHYDFNPFTCPPWNLE
jgi:hypothetical protein